jgi:murein DD-endopeptidase MepM/ murein hydrolase activator NlpD
MRLRVLVVSLVVPLLLWAALPLASDGAPKRRSAKIAKKIASKRSVIGAKKGKEHVLSSTIEGYSRRIGALQSDIGSLQRRQMAIQADLDAKRAELARIQARLRAERARLTRLRARLAEARAALTQRLVELYKADKPDVVTVVLESDGFADLLTRTEFMKRVSDQDARIVDLVKQAKREATRIAVRLDALEARSKRVAATILAHRDEVAAIRGQLVDRRDSYAAVRADKKQSLVAVRSSRIVVEEDLEELEKEQAKIQATLAAAAQSAGAGGVPAGPIKRGSGSLIFPVSGSISSPFGFRWGRLHAGIDIPAPIGTPIRAADSGKVVLMAPTGGYGNYTCIQHNASLSTCYGHQSRFGTSVGASVTKGQVFGFVGNTGHSTGPHLHFETRVGGRPVDPMGYL